MVQKVDSCLHVIGFGLDTCQSGLQVLLIQLLLGCLTCDARFGCLAVLDKVTVSSILSLFGLAVGAVEVRCEGLQKSEHSLCTSLLALVVAGEAWTRGILINWRCLHECGLCGLLVEASQDEQSLVDCFKTFLCCLHGLHVGFLFVVSLLGGLLQCKGLFLDVLLQLLDLFLQRISLGLETCEVGTEICGLLVAEVSVLPGLA